MIGNLVRDIVGGTPPRAGGAVFYQARVFAEIEHAIDVRLVTRCAPQDRELLLERLEEFSLPITWRPARETQTFSFHYDGDHRVMEIVSLGDTWTPDDVEGWITQAIGDAEWIMLGALTRADFPPETLAAPRRDGRQLLIDAQGLVRLGSLVRDGHVPPESFAAVRVLKPPPSRRKGAPGASRSSPISSSARVGRTCSSHAWTSAGTAGRRRPS